MEEDRLKRVDAPIFLNLPVAKIVNDLNAKVSMPSCEEWYAYKFTTGVSEADRKFFGFNDGNFFNSPESSGMLKRNEGVQQSICHEIGKNVPYFREIDNKEINQYLYEELEKLNEISFNSLKKEAYLSGLPDGAITIEAANEDKLKYKLQINDQRMARYHRANGITKINIGGEQATNGVINVIGGMLSLADLVNKAYIKKLSPDLTIISSVQLMPFKENATEIIQKLISFTGSTFYPLAVSLLMPLFMYTIVLEKEAKLIENMKINGLKMTYYWLANFVYNFIVYLVTISLFLFFGGVVFKLNFFSETMFTLHAIVFFGWGLNQIGLAFFFQAFLNNARSATSFLLTSNRLHNFALDDFSQHQPQSDHFRLPVECPYHAAFLPDLQHFPHNLLSHVQLRLQRLHRQLG